MIQYIFYNAKKDKLICMHCNKNEFDKNIRCANNNCIINNEKEKERYAIINR